MNEYIMLIKMLDVDDEKEKAREKWKAKLNKDDAVLCGASGGYTR